MLAHLGRAGGAVEADEVDLERLERRQRGADLRAHQHRAGGLDGHLGEQRQPDAGRPERAPGAVQGRLGLEQVLGGLDEDRVRAPLDQAGDLGLVGVAQLGVRDVPQCGELGPRSHRSDDPTRPARGGETVRHLARQPGATDRQVVDAVGDAVLAEVGEVGAEGVGLDGVATHREVGLVHRPDDVRAGGVEDLVATLVALEVLERQVVVLDHGAHSAVGDDDPLAQCREESVVGG